MTLENGYLLNQRYRIVDILGQGGMGAVYRAVDENLDVSVAVKENSFFSEDYARQFQREAKILASLRHPNLPRVFDYFVLDQQGQYLVMDYIEGEDLRQWMGRKEEVTEIEIIQIGLAICNALIYLSSRKPGIVHRDIKPGNVKITPDGDVVLVDFGLVKILDDKEITTTAARAMTPGYSPPEQYGSDPTDNRSDIFSLGSTLYAALTGYLPEDSLARATGKAVLTPLQDHNPMVSDQTAGAIEKALELRFEDRWQTAEEFKKALLEARKVIPKDNWISHRLAATMLTDLESAPVTEPNLEEARVEKRFRFLFTKNGDKVDPVWIIFGVLVFVLVGLLVTSLLYPEGLQDLFSGNLMRANTRERTITMVDTLQTESISGAVSKTIQAEEGNSGNSNQTPTPSPTTVGGGAGMFAYVSERTGTPQIWLFDIDTRQATQLTFLEDGACQPDWSPDGKQIVFTSPCAKKRSRYPGSSLIIMDVETGALSHLPATLEGDFDPAWSPDGEWIAYTSLINGELQIKKIRPDNLMTIKLSNGGYDELEPAWSADGTQLAYIRIRSVGQIWIMNADGSDPVQFTLSGAIDNSDPAWYPRENLILFSQVLGLGSPSKQLYGMRLEDIGEAEEYVILPGAPSEYTPLMDNVDVSPDGYWLAFDYWYFDVLSDIYVMAFPGANLIQMTEDPAPDYDAAWRPFP